MIGLVTRLDSGRGTGRGRRASLDRPCPHDRLQASLPAPIPSGGITSRRDGDHSLPPVTVEEPMQLGRSLLALAERQRWLCLVLCHCCGNGGHRLATRSAKRSSSTNRSGLAGEPFSQNPQWSPSAERYAALVTQFTTHTPCVCVVDGGFRCRSVS